MTGVSGGNEGGNEGNEEKSRKTLHDGIQGEREGNPNETGHRIGQSDNSFSHIDESRPIAFP